MGGTCDCITSHPHVRWSEDGHCYPIHSKGPCAQGLAIDISKSSMEPECLPNVCTAGTFYDLASCSEIALRNGQQPENIAGACHDLSNIQGSCHKLGTRSKMLTIVMKTFSNSLVTFIFKGSMWGAPM